MAELQASFASSLPWFAKAVFSPPPSIALFPIASLSRADLRAQKIALGPVAVFGASNFPLAFSVAGGNTASALAAGCPVVAKAHASHFGPSELVGRAIQCAVAQRALPEGVFSLLIDNTDSRNAVASALVQHPAIRAVGFTGSRRAGRSLVALAATREERISVYAEMSSINPVFLLSAALAQRAESIAKGFIDSVTLGTGQFCTKPGLVVGVAGPDFARFRAAAQTTLQAKSATTMLNPRHPSRLRRRSFKLGRRQGPPGNLYRDCLC